MEKRTVYDIQEEIYSLTDEETGEIKDYDSFVNLCMERDQKIENAVLWAKDLYYMANEIKTEIGVLKERMESKIKKADKLMAFVDEFLCGQNFETARCKVSHRKSTVCALEDEFVQWAMDNGRDDLLKYESPKANVSYVKKMLASGEEIPFAKLVEKNNIQVK